MICKQQNVFYVSMSNLHVTELSIYDVFTSTCGPNWCLACGFSSGGFIMMSVVCWIADMA